LPFLQIFSSTIYLLTCSIKATIWLVVDGDRRKTVTGSLGLRAGKLLCCSRTGALICQNILSFSFHYLGFVLSWKPFSFLPLNNAEWQMLHSWSWIAKKLKICSHLR
jgi:hypothetical protein